MWENNSLPNQIVFHSQPLNIGGRIKIKELATLSLGKAKSHTEKSFILEIWGKEFRKINKKILLIRRLVDLVYSEDSGT